MADPDGPRRIQRKRTKGWRMPPNTVYVGRPTQWGNPFRVGDDNPLYPHYNGPQMSAAQVVVEFQSAYISDDLPVSRDEIRDELRGRDLVCWCPLSAPCHADVLLEIANAAVPPTPKETQ